MSYCDLAKFAYDTLKVLSKFIVIKKLCQDKDSISLSLTPHSDCGQDCFFFFWAFSITWMDQNLFFQNSPELFSFSTRPNCKALLDMYISRYYHYSAPPYRHMRGNPHFTGWLCSSGNAGIPARTDRLGNEGCVILTALPFVLTVCYSVMEI